MRIADFLTEAEMPYRDAQRVFADRGIDISGMNSKDLKQAWYGLLKKSHPDAGGSSQESQIINAAYDTLKIEANYAPTAGRAEKTATHTAPQTGDPNKWMIYGFNGNFFNSGAKWTGGRDRFAAIIHAALAHFKTKDHVIALFVQCEARPNVLEMIYMNGQPFVSGNIPSIPYKWAEFSSPSGDAINSLARNLVIKITNAMYA